MLLYTRVIVVNSAKQTFFNTCRSFSAIPATAKRTLENNPTKQTSEDHGLFYTIPEMARKELFEFGGLPKSFETNTNTFGETCLMVRKPALEVINFLKSTDFTRPAIKYVLYGNAGCGKSLSLAHILHYAYCNGFYIVHVPWVWNWFRNERTEVTNSSSHPGLVDLPLIAAHWLKHFHSQNSHLIKENLKIKREYVWNQRESTPAGSLLFDLVSHGINRVKYACDCIDAVITELKFASNENKCKLIVTIDGFNALFGGITNLKNDERIPITPDKVTLVRTFLELTKHDLKNGAIILTVDQLSAGHNTLKTSFPISLLGRKGFEHIDPFINIHVKELSELEFNSMLDYYEDRMWLQRRGGRQELSFVSNNNPYQLMNLCASL